ncbi:MULTISPECIES: hypothetical protein [unclassified Streptomyces]|uniref:hypothetical protein n=1 Tax=unclassified Streptomyces TaxID=2593676 RepID=UPI0003625882|nr:MULTISPECIES: hypothetical protein [unclassified Streptomyces]MYT33910.1 hypothetical protein [Streptomyces sp. SID8354]
MEFVPDFWGYELLLNRYAVKLLKEEASRLLELIGKALPKKLGLLVKAYIYSRKWWVERIDQGTGIRFSSPWLMPGALVPTVWDDGEGHHPEPENPGDTYLWWSVWEEGRGWSKDIRFPSHHSMAAPALLANQDRFLCVHRGGHKDASLYLTVFKDGKWATGEKLPDAMCTDSGPALAWHPQHGLFVAYYKPYQPNTFKPHGLMWSRRSGDGLSGTWDEPARITTNVLQVEARPALCFDGDRLLCVFKEGAKMFGRNSLFWAEMDLTKRPWTWSNYQPMGKASESAPSLTKDQNGNILCAWTDNGRVRLAVRKKGTYDWQPLPDPSDVTSNDSPILAHVPRPGHVSTLCMTHSGANDMALSTATGEDLTQALPWKAPEKLPAHSSAVAPAVIYGDYQLENGERKLQAVCVHRGHAG